MRPYLYIAANQRGKENMLNELRGGYTVEKVADIPADQSMAHFVAAPFHRGLRMELYRISQPGMEQYIREHPELEGYQAPAS
jgi:hypothetical protein